MLPVLPAWGVMVGLVAGLSVGRVSAAENATGRPNFLVIVADDLGFSDLGCYGGEIDTPELDRLAAGGLRFTQFYNTARCWPSRAALLTGYYAQQVRRDSVPGIVSGGRGRRPAWAKLLTEYLKPLGYRSYHSGKWHIDGTPLQNGFDRSYRVDDQDRYFAPRLHWEDDIKLPQPKMDSGYYATVAIANHAVKCLRDHAEHHAGKPFFVYLCFTCPHFPLQALPEDIQKYRGKYRAGWDALRRQRHERQQALGLVRCSLSPRTDGVPAWEMLSETERDEWEVRMAVHAAMVDRMDREIGRVLQQVKTMGAWDDTLVLFLSDNGASAERIVRGDGHDPQAPPGSARWYRCLEPGWANLANAPLRYSKIYVHEGGISTPLIVHWPKGIRGRGELRHNPCHLIDVPPTLMALAGGQWPPANLAPAAPPPPGKNLVPVFDRDNSVRHDVLWWYHSGNRAIRMGDWKLVSVGEKGPWELYDLANDRSETTNLAERHPDKVRELAQVWQKHLEEFRRHATADGKAIPTP
ncbi:MAG: arylsulfatase [Gemmataceae bacterium]|nr:arylsulfatase [Gemmataceae bacterium]MDW8266173.1 arylsulfatase [Gemmataceae bacterium]